MIRVSNLRLAWGKATLSVPELRIGPGETLGLTGPAGRPLLNALAGLIRKYEGRIFFQDRELQEWSRDFFQQIGAALPRTGLFPHLTAKENLAFAARLYAGKSETPAKSLAAAGLSLDAGRRVKLFTPGMKKRLAIARAAAHGPKALFLDEPLEGSNADEAALVEKLLAAQKRAGRCVVVAARDQAWAERFCDRIFSAASVAEAA